MIHRLDPLPYAFNSLEPFIDESTMRIHHGKHHQTYVDKLNAALKGEDLYGDWPVERLVCELADLPDSIRTAVRNHGGGHLNHSFFWSILKKGTKLSGKIESDIISRFGSFVNFKEKFINSATLLFGSGWTWLVLRNGSLEISTTVNQDSPITSGDIPILGVDVWEHAYYLKYQNRRLEYLESFFNVINWEKVNEFYVSRIKK